MSFLLYFVLVDLLYLVLRASLMSCVISSDRSNRYADGFGWFVRVGALRCAASAVVGIGAADVCATIDSVVLNRIVSISGYVMSK